MGWKLRIMGRYPVPRNGVEWEHIRHSKGLKGGEVSLVVDIERHKQYITTEGNFISSTMWRLRNMRNELELLKK